MGSWSVSCGISNIAITAGHNCVLLPLKENNGSEMGGYCPATLPIFGDYNDYGGIENIIEDDNTKLIEDHFGISIDKFCEFLVDGKFTYNRSEVKPIERKLEKNGKLDEVKNWRFMWIDRQVYEFMKLSHDKHDKGYMDLGTPDMLKLLGFESVGESNNYKNYDPKRFKFLWRKGDVEVYSDGNTLLSKTNQYIFYVGKGCSSSIETYIDLPEELIKLKDMTSYEAWRYAGGKHKGKQELSYIFGDRYGDYDHEEFIEKLRNMKLPQEGAEIPKKEIKLLYKKYFNDLETYGDRIAQLLNVRANLHPMSGAFKPHELYLTPQCGEFEQHQILLEKFAEINKSYIEAYDNED